MSPACGSGHRRLLDVQDNAPLYAAILPPLQDAKARGDWLRSQVLLDRRVRFELQKKRRVSPRMSQDLFDGVNPGYCASENPILNDSWACKQLKTRSDHELSKENGGIIRPRGIFSKHFLSLSLSLFRLLSSLFHLLSSLVFSLPVHLLSSLVLSLLFHLHLSCLVFSCLFHLLLSCLVFSCLCSLSLSLSLPLSQTLLFSRSRSTLRAKILGAWCYLLSVLFFVVLLFLDHQQSHFALHISTMLWPRNVTHPLSFSNSFTPKCWSTRSIL